MKDSFRRLLLNILSQPNGADCATYYAAITLATEAGFNPQVTDIQSSALFDRTTNHWVLLDTRENYDSLMEERDKLNKTLKDKGFNVNPD
jgi:hypothetical protein